MKIKKEKVLGFKLKSAKDKFDAEAARELGVDVPNANLSTTKIIYAYELGLRDKL